MQAYTVNVPTRIDYCNTMNDLQLRERQRSCIKWYGLALHIEGLVSTCQVSDIYSTASYDLTHLLITTKRHVSIRHTKKSIYIGSPSIKHRQPSYEVFVLIE